MLTRLLLFNAVVLTAAAMSLLLFADEKGAPASAANIDSIAHITFIAYPSNF